MPTTTSPTVLRPVRGLLLRSVLVTVLRSRGRPMTVAELVSALHDRGLTTTGRPGKVISDALRWEMGRGRVVQVARATYRVGRVPRTTAWRMRQRLAGLEIPTEGDVARGAATWVDLTEDAAVGDPVSRRGGTVEGASPPP